MNDLAPRPPAWIWLTASKEVRALMPVWTPAAVIAVLLLVSGDWAAIAASEIPVLDFLLEGTPVALALTPILLGATVTGHEISNRTWPLLLTQPVSRRALLGVKMAVLIVMLTASTFLSVWAYSRLERLVELGEAFLGPVSAWHPFILAPLIAGLVLAPWFALLTRSVLGGVILAAGAPLGLYAAATLAFLATYGVPVTRLDEVWATGFVLAVWRFGLLVMGAVGAAGLWHTFVRGDSRVDLLERRASISGWGSFASTGQATRVRHSPSWALVGKELRLQTPTLALAALSSTVWCLFLFLPGVRGLQLFSAFAVLHVILVTLFAGALSSAEERRMGVVDLQLMLPMAAWRQWFTKVSIVVFISGALGAGAVVLLSLVSGEFAIRSVARLFLSDGSVMVTAMLALMSTAIFASSVSRTGFAALTAACVATIAVAPVAAQTARLISDVLWALVGQSQLDRPQSLAAARFLMQRSNILFSAALIAFCCLSLWFAFQNHRRADRSVRRTVFQMLVLYGAFAVTIFFIRLALIASY